MVSTGSLWVKYSCRMSRDGRAYTDLLTGVRDVSGLLFVIQDGSTYKFSAFIDGPLAQPADPTQIKTSPCAVSLYSISGAYDAPIKIPLPAEKSQRVVVAGREGVVRGSDGQSGGNVCIEELEGAACWLGHANPGPAADLSRCQLWVKKAHLPTGYRREVNRHRNGTLATRTNFTATDIEVLSLVGGVTR